MKPYIAMHAPPITHLGSILIIATKGEMKDTTMHMMPVVSMVKVEASLESATQLMDSP